MSIAHDDAPIRSPDQTFGAVLTLHYPRTVTDFCAFRSGCLAAVPVRASTGPEGGSEMHVLLLL